MLHFNVETSPLDSKSQSLSWWWICHCFASTKWHWKWGTRKMIFDSFMVRIESLTNWSWFVDNWCGCQDLFVDNWLVNDGSVMDDGCDDLGSMNWWSSLCDDGVESMDVISGVVDGSDAAIRFDQGVLSLNDSSITSFTLVLDVSGVVILHSIVERVTRVILY